MARTRLICLFLLLWAGMADLWGKNIHAGGLLLIRETKGDTTTDILPLYDGTGHVIALTNPNKDLLGTYAYGPFGEKISATGPQAHRNPWRWATKYQDEETGLYYFGLRYYDPVTGQWLSRDPLGESESINLYAYCHNDPINRVDVLGMSEASFNDEILLLASPEFQRLFAEQPTNWDSWRSWFMGTLDGISREHLEDDERFTVLVATANRYEGLFRASLERNRVDHNYARAMLGAWDLEQRQQRKAGEIGWAMLDTPFHLGTAAFSGLLGTDITTGSTLTWKSWEHGGGFGLAEVSPGERVFAAAMAFLPIGRIENVADDVARMGMRTETSLAGGLADWTEAKRLKTVLGNGADVAPFKGKPGYNVLEMDASLPLETRKFINAKWLDDAIDRGDELILKTDPIAWDRFMREIGKESFYNELELPQLLRRGVIDSVILDYP